MRAATGKGVRKILSTIGYGGTGFDLRGDAARFAQEWASGKASTRLEFTAILKKAGLTMDDVMAEALGEEIDFFERLDRMLASAEARRNNALHEIDRHRSALGAAVRQVVDEVEDAEFQDVETGEVSGDAALTTDREQRANRANAKSSTGPRTADGKARVAQNALRHGLNVPGNRAQDSRP